MEGIQKTTYKSLIFKPLESSNKEETKKLSETFWTYLMTGHLSGDYLNNYIQESLGKTFIESKEEIKKILGDYWIETHLKNISGFLSSQFGNISYFGGFNVIDSRSNDIRISKDINDSDFGKEDFSGLFFPSWSILSDEIWFSNFQHFRAEKLIIIIHSDYGEGTFGDEIDGETIWQLYNNSDGRKVITLHNGVDFFTSSDGTLKIKGLKEKASFLGGGGARMSFLGVSTSIDNTTIMETLQNLSVDFLKSVYLNIAFNNLSREEMTSNKGSGILVSESMGGVSFSYANISQEEKRKSIAGNPPEYYLNKIFEIYQKLIDTKRKEENQPAFYFTAI